MIGDIIVYQGIRCSLALMQERYLPELIRIVNDMRVTQGVRIRPPVSLYEEEDWIRNLHKKKSIDQVFAVLAHGEDQERRYIGVSGLHSIQWPNGVATTGSLLGGKDELGKGYGTEAKLLLQNHAFHSVGLRKLTSSVKAFNVQSLGHLIKCGYTIIGRHRKQEFHKGTYADEVLLECFREDWEPIWRVYLDVRELPKLTDEQKELVERESRSEAKQ